MAHPNRVDVQPACWRMSSYSDRGNCVAVASHAGSHVAVRNSNYPDAGAVLFSPAAMHAWIAGIKAGEFDYLA